MGLYTLNGFESKAFQRTPLQLPRKRHTIPAARITAITPVRNMPSKIPAPPMDRTKGRE